jgi:methanogenic corrinoid protein MtbC1
MIVVMTDHERALKEAADEYRQAKQRADKIMAGPRERLAQRVKAAYEADMKKADILRATGHVWSRTWLDQAVRDGARTDQQ